MPAVAASEACNCTCILLLYLRCIAVPAIILEEEGDGLRLPDGVIGDVKGRRLVVIVFVLLQDLAGNTRRGKSTHLLSNVSRLRHFAAATRHHVTRVRQAIVNTTQRGATRHLSALHTVQRIDDHSDV